MPRPARGPALERWWERVIEPKVAVALGLSGDPDEEAIARGLRPLARLPEEGSLDDMLWARFLYGVELACTGPLGPRGDEAELANNVVEFAIVPPGRQGEDRYGTRAWDRELGVGFAEADGVLRRLVAREIAPRLVKAGLFALL